MTQNSVMMKQIEQSVNKRLLHKIIFLNIIDLGKVDPIKEGVLIPAFKNKMDPEPSQWDIYKEPWGLKQFIENYPYIQREDKDE